MRVAALALFVCLLSFDATSAEWPAEFKLLTVPGANKIQRHDLRQINAKELSYSVNLDYPKMAIA